MPQKETAECPTESRRASGFSGNLPPLSKGRRVPALSPSTFNSPPGSVSPPAAWRIPSNERRKHDVFGSVVEGMEIIKKIEQLGTSDGKPSGLVRIADCGEISEDKKKNALESDKGKKKKSVKKAISSDDDSSDARVKKRRRSAVTDKRKKRRKYSSDSSSSDSDSESDSSDSDSYSESDSDSSSSSSDGRRRKKRSTKSKGKHRKNKQKESKKLKRPAKKSKRKSRRQMSTSTMGPNHERDRSMPHIDIQDLFHKIVADCYPELEEAHSTYFPLKGNARKEYGDYAFFGVIDICRQLREKDPKLFDHTGPIAIANKINEKFESWKCDDDMIKRLSLNDAGILTFSLEGRWIAQRINNMLKDGIDTWAPTIFATNTRGKAVFIFPTNPGMGADIVRAIYIKDALANLCSYSGVDVGSGFCDDGARLKATKIHQTSLIGPSHDFYTDLGTFWYGANTQKADVMVYMTPHRLREYIEKCHITAANEGCLPDDWEGLLTCCGFRTFSGEQPELRDLWNRLEATWSLFPVECKVDGYTCRAFFECAFKFTCLKSHRLAECIFKDADIGGERNTFLSLLRTQALASSQVKDSDRNLFKLNVLAGKERELGLHLVEFTEVINRACGAFLPHVLCEYLCDLSKLFKFCYTEVWPSENKLSLCEATKVVMNKCFELLGIAPPTQSSDEWTKEFKSFFKRKETRATKLHIIPSSEDARNEHPNSRFEIFSMNVSVAHSQFEEGNVTGRVTFVDKCRLADGDGWVMLDKNDDCHVSYFDREWYDAVAIYNGSYIPLGNTSSVRSVPFSSTIEVALLIKATSKNNDQSYLIYNGSGSADLTKFWEDGALNTKCGTIEFNSEDGRILLDFVAIKDAVDTKMRLVFKPKFVKGEQLRLSGSITASYGKDILGDCGFLGEYTAHIFRADPTEDYMRGPFSLPYSLPLHKSALAVPANGCLRVQANLVDLDTKKRIVDEVELCKSENGVSRWVINCGDKGDFELMVKWVH